MSFTFRFLSSCCPVWLLHLFAVPISVLHYADVSVSNISIIPQRERRFTKEGILYYIHPGQCVVLCTPGCHNLNCDLCLCKARVGCYYVKAVAIGQKLALLNHSNLVSFFILTSVKSKNRPTLALLAYMFITVLPHDVFEQAQIGDLSDCRSENALPAIMDTACYTLVTLRKLLLRAGDTEVNPGPSRTDTRTGLCNYTP